MLNNNYYKAVKRLREVCEANTLVQQVIYARLNEKNLYKNTLFPLIHINPAPTPYTSEKSNNFIFEIGVFDIRTNTNQDKDTIFEGNNNIIDNHNTTYAILNEILTALSKDNGDNIYLTDISSLTPLFLSDVNGLDGWGTTVELKLPNYLNNC